MGEKNQTKLKNSTNFIQVPVQVDSNNKFGNTLSFDIEPLPAVANCAHMDNCNKRLMSIIERKKTKTALSFNWKRNQQKC